MGTGPSCLNSAGAVADKYVSTPLKRVHHSIRQSSAPPHEGALLPSPPDSPTFTHLLSPVSSLEVFSYKQLMDATNNFDPSYVLGEGGFGMVYKGFLPMTEGEAVKPYPVAIKKLNAEGYQGHQEWLREIVILGNVVHPSLVQLFGYCVHEAERLLVYEFVGLGSLDYHLFEDPGEGQQPLSWKQRVCIALGAARGLAYLHKRNVIHRDFKAANILLDENFSVKLTDFGLAKEGPQLGKTHVTTVIMGTLGYLDPCYAETGRLTKKSDVYAYGVLLLELITGKRAVGIGENSETLALTTWAMPFIERRTQDMMAIVDKRLLEPFPRPVVRLLATLAKHCLREDPKARPAMQMVVENLEPLLGLMESKKKAADGES